jgi:hypothetical protein
VVAVTGLASIKEKGADRSSFFVAMPSSRRSARQMMWWVVVSPYSVPVASFYAVLSPSFT